MRRLSLAVCFFCLGPGFARSAPLPIQVLGSTSYSWNDNFSRASDDVDVRAVGLFSATLSASHARQIAPNLMWRTQVEGQLRLADRYQDLHEGEVSLQSGLQRKLGLGRTAARMGFDVTVRAHGAEVSAQDGASMQFRAFYDQPLSEWLTVRTGGDAVERTARNDTFSLAHQRLHVALVLDVSARLRCSLGASRQWGLFTAGCSGPRFAQALAGAYGPEVAAYFQTLPTATTSTFAPDWLIYRARGETDSAWLEISPALSDRTALAVRWEMIDTTNVVGAHYRQNLLHFSLVHAF